MSFGRRSQLTTSRSPLPILQTKKSPAQAGLLISSDRLLDDLCYHTGANSTTTFANREAQTVFHRNRRN